MKVLCLYDKITDIKDLVAHPLNRNKHPKEQIERFAKILEYQGWRYPVKVSKRSGYITSGHGRILAARLNKWKQVPVNYQDYESEEQEYADVQADNAIGLWAELSIDEIKMDLAGLPDFDSQMLGLKDLISMKESLEDLPDIENIDKDTMIMSFTVKNEDAEEIKKALSKALKMIPKELDGNKNGLALFHICELFLRSKK